MADDRLHSQRLFSIHVIGFFNDKGRAAADNLRAGLAGQVGLTFGGHSEEFPHRPEISSVLEARYILGNPQGGLFDRQRDATMIGAGKLGRAHDTHAHSRRHRLSTGFAATGWPLTWVVSGLYLGLLVAGLAAPLVGRLIHRRGGRPVLAASAVLLAVGLLGIAFAPSLVVFLVAWMIVGLGMSVGLYDATFSTLGRIYGQAARQHMTTLTLFGGFASTVCWPLSAYFVSELGWRGACMAYAAIHVGLTIGVWPSRSGRGPSRCSNPRLRNPQMGQVVTAACLS